MIEADVLLRPEGSNNRTAEKLLQADESSFSIIVRYWRSFEHLEALANNSEDTHLQPSLQIARASDRLCDGCLGRVRPRSDASDPVDLDPRHRDVGGVVQGQRGDVGTHT